MIKNYLKIAFRGFWRHKAFTFINIIGLSIGISAALVIYLIVHFDLSFDKFEKDGDRIYRVVTNFTYPEGPVSNPGLSVPLQLAAKNQVSGIEASTPLFRLVLPDVYIPQKNAKPVKFKQEKTVALTDSDYFNIVHYKWLAGSAKAALNGPYQVVLTSEQAKIYFPAIPFEQIIGKTIMYDTVKTTVTGIVQTITDNTDFAFNDFISFSTAFADKGLKSELRLNNWVGTSVRGQFFVKLLPTASAAGVAQQLNTILAKNSQPKKDMLKKISLQPLSDIHFSVGGYGGIISYDAIANKTTLYSLLAIAAFLLLLGCINFINLTTAQATQRAKEIGIRKTMGSSRAQLIVQFLSETFFITLIAVIISALIAPFILQLFSGFIHTGIKLDVIHQPGIVVFLLTLAIVVSLLSGFYPAIILSGYEPVAVLKNQAQNSSKTRNAWMRKSLTVSQFVIAQFFIMATVLVGKQIYYATHKELGFKKDGIIVINSPWKNRTQSKNLAFLNHLQAMPHVEMVSMGNDAPSSENTSSTEGTYIDGKKEVRIGDLAEKFGDENYINLYHIKLLAGRNLEPVDSNKAFLVNQALINRLGFKNPQDAVGKFISNFNGDAKMEIIGVVSDFHQESLHAPIAPLAILRANNEFGGVFHIALQPQTAGGNEWQQAIVNMQVAWAHLYPNDDFEYEFVDKSIAKLYEKEQHTATLLSWATGLSILISCLGLLGLAIYTTNQRTKEIGVRKVLGASVAQIVTLLSTELILLIVLAFIIVTPVAIWAMNKWMQGFADRTAISWWIFAISGAGMLLTAVITSSFQTVKAAVMNPVKSLRSE
jgi:ABC-type antimicrobial peptide transport system permease subunit